MRHTQPGEAQMQARIVTGLLRTRQMWSVYRLLRIYIPEPIANTHSKFYCLGSGHSLTLEETVRELASCSWDLCSLNFLLQI
jgi:hypothetical protein